MEKKHRLGRQIQAGSNFQPAGWRISMKDPSSCPSVLRQESLPAHPDPCTQWQQLWFLLGCSTGMSSPNSSCQESRAVAHRQSRPSSDCRRLRREAWPALEEEETLLEAQMTHGMIPQLELQCIWRPLAKL